MFHLHHSFTVTFCPSSSLESVLVGFSTDRSLFQARSTCSTGCSVEICTPLAAGEWAPPALSLHWPWCLQGCFSLLTPHSPSYCCIEVFFPFLKYALTKEQITLLIGLALSSSGSLLEPSKTVPYLTWGSFWILLKETTSAAPCYTNLIM